MPFIDLNPIAKPAVPTATGVSAGTIPSDASVPVPAATPSVTATPTPAPAATPIPVEDTTPVVQPAVESVAPSENTVEIAPIPAPVQTEMTTKDPMGGEVNIAEDGVKVVSGPQFSTPKPEPTVAKLADPKLDEKLAKLPVMDVAEMQDDAEPKQENSPTATDSQAAQEPAVKTVALEPEKEMQKPETKTKTDIKSMEAPTQPMPDTIKLGTEELPNKDVKPEPEKVDQLKPAEHEITFGVEKGQTDQNTTAIPEIKTAATAPKTVPTPEVKPVEFSKPSLPPIQDNMTKKANNLPVLPAVQNMQPSAPAIQPPVSQLESAPNDLSVKSYSLTDILLQAVKLNASDVHLVFDRRAMARIDGVLKPLQSAILDDATLSKMLSEVVDARMKGTNLDTVKDLDLAYSIDDQGARFRVNIFRQQGHLGAVFRLISTNIRTIEQLKLPPILHDFTKFNQGLVLVTGASGSGKSTTIAAILNEINMSQPTHIVTIEDPIEYVYPKGLAVVDQRSVYDDTASWHDALRAVLREDPNVVLVGEMRDFETISAALTVAETGHLVFATLHTNGAAQSIDRIIDVFPEAQQNQVRTQLASVLLAVVSQKLIPVNGGGRRVAAELMIASPAVRNAIREAKVYQIDNMIQTSADVGMITMEKSLISLLREGIISIETAEQYANNVEDLITMLGLNKKKN